MITYCVGIDPGKKGGIGLIVNNDGVRTYAASPYSDDALKRTLLTLSDVINYVPDAQVVACVEQVNAMPKQGVVSVFTFGKSAGFIEGALYVLSIPYQLVRPQVWKKEFGLNSNKQGSIEVCQKLFPTVSLLATTRSRVPHDGMAEALLMAEYASRRLL